MAFQSSSLISSSSTDVFLVPQRTLAAAHMLHVVPFEGHADKRRRQSRKAKSNKQTKEQSDKSAQKTKEQRNEKQKIEQRVTYKSRMIKEQQTKEQNDKNTQKTKEQRNKSNR